MAIVTVYNRDGTEYGTLDTNQYLFNNSLIGFEPTKLDVNIYPYVKINGVYYINDGGEFASKGRADNSAGLMDIAYCYIETIDDEERVPLKELSFLKTVDKNSNNIGDIEIIGNNDFCATVTLKNYKANNRNLQSVGYKANQEMQFLPNPNNYGRPYRNKDNQGMLPLDGSSTVDRYYWDFTPDQNDYFIFSNFNESNTSIKIECIEVIDNIVYLKYKDRIFDPWKTSSQWELKKTPYITLCIKESSQNFQNSDLIPIYTAGGTFGQLWKDVYDRPNSICMITSADPEGNELYINGQQSSTNTTPANFNVLVESDVFLLPLKLYNNMKIIIYPASIIVNGQTINIYSLDSFNNDKDYKEYVQKLYDMFAQTENSFQYTLLWNSNNNEGLHASDDIDGFEMRFNIGNSYFASQSYSDNFSGYNCNLTIKDYYIPQEEFIETSINNLTRKESLQKFHEGLVYFNSRESSKLNLITDRDYEETYSNICRLIYSTKINKKGSLPSYISLINNMSYDKSFGGDVSWRGMGYGSFQVENDTSNTWPLEYGYYYTYFGYKWGGLFEKKTEVIGAAAVAIGVSTSSSIGVAIVASQNEKNLDFQNPSTGSSWWNDICFQLNDDTNQYTVISTYGKKVRIDFILKDGSVHSYYVMPYASVDIPFKTDTIDDYSVDVVEED